MTVPENRVKILKALRRYRFLRCGQLRQFVLPTDDGSLTRRHLRFLGAEGCVRKYNPKIVDPLGNGFAPPVYTITCKGASVLAAITGDADDLLNCEPSFTNWMSVNHWCSLGALAKLLDDALADKNYVRMTARYFEYDVKDPAATEPHERFVTYVRLGEKLSFCPDMVFETEFRGARRVWPVEYETGSDTPQRVAAKKHKGVAAYGDGGHFKKLFPQSNDFRCLAFCPNPAWRDALRREIGKLPGAKYWAFVATNEITAENLLGQPLIWTADKGPFPLLPEVTEDRPREGGGEGKGEGAGNEA